MSLRSERKSKNAGSRVEIFNFLLGTLCSILTLREGHSRIISEITLLLTSTTNPLDTPEPLSYYFIDPDMLIRSFSSSIYGEKPRRKEKAKNVSKYQTKKEFRQIFHNHNFPLFTFALHIFLEIIDSLCNIYP